MPKFIQLHVLDSYGPSRLNCDENGRPKTAIAGGVPRGRVSSQSRKRAWRTSDQFANVVGDAIGIQTRSVVAGITEHLGKLHGDKLDTERAKKVASQVESLWGGDVMFKFSRDEWSKMLSVAAEHYAADGDPAPVTLDEFLASQVNAIDVALWGRMLASEKDYSIRAACSVSHSITTHRSMPEDDYFSACDDLNPLGAGHIDSRKFTSGTYYTYACIDTGVLIANLGESASQLATPAIRACIETATQVSPAAGQSTHGSIERAAYALVEIGDQAPRSLQAAFVRPVWGDDQLAASASALEKWRDKLDTVYGQAWDRNAVLDVTGDAPRGSLTSLIEIARV